MIDDFDGYDFCSSTKPGKCMSNRLIPRVSKTWTVLEAIILNYNVLGIHAQGVLQYWSNCAHVKLGQQIKRLDEEVKSENIHPIGNATICEDNVIEKIVTSEEAVEEFGIANHSELITLDLRKAVVPGC